MKYFSNWGHIVHSLQTLAQRWIPAQLPADKSWRPPAAVAGLLLTVIWTVTNFFAWSAALHNETSLSTQAVELALELERSTNETFASFDHFLLAARQLREKNLLPLDEMAKLNLPISTDRAFLGVADADGNIIYHSSSL